MSVLMIILTIVICYLLLQIVNLNNKLKVVTLYRNHTEESILTYKKMLYDKALDSDDLELYAKVQDYSESRRSEFLKLLEKYN